MSASLFAGLKAAEVSNRRENIKLGKAWYLVNKISNRVGKVSKKPFISMDLTVVKGIHDGSGIPEGTAGYAGEITGSASSHAIFSGPYFEKELKRFILTAFNVPADKADDVARNAFPSVEQNAEWLEKNRLTCGWPQGSFASFDEVTKLSVGWAFIADWMTGGLGDAGFFDGQLVMEFETKENTKETDEYVKDAAGNFVKKTTTFVNTYPVRKVPMSEVKAALPVELVPRIFGSVERLDALVAAEG